MGKFGQIAVYIGLLSVLYGLIMAIGIIPAGWILGITAGGALNGASTFFLLGIACFFWPEPGPHAVRGGGGEPAE